jgi:hypothetical protein
METLRPTAAERREYRQAEGRIRESIQLKDILPDHTYPRKEEDLQTIQRYHTRYGVPDMGLWYRALRLVHA